MQSKLWIAAVGCMATLMVRRPWLMIPASYRPDSALLRRGGIEFCASAQRLARPRACHHFSV
jgi:hypothetical protein